MVDLTCDHCSHSLSTVGHKAASFKHLVSVKCLGQMNLMVYKNHKAIRVLQIEENVPNREGNVKKPLL